MSWRYRIGPCGIDGIKFIKNVEKEVETKKWKDSMKNGREKKISESKKNN
jgi:hypothetical protein